MVSSLLHYVSSIRIFEHPVVSKLTALFSVGTILMSVWVLFFHGNRKNVVIPESRKNVPKPWYLSDAMKVGMTLAILGAILAVLFGGNK